MSKLQSLVLLTHSMSLAEKKAFRIRSLRYKAKSDYMILYDIIEQNREQPAPVVLPEFLKERPRASFETTIKYLYDLLLDSMLDLRKEQDSFYFLFNLVWVNSSKLCLDRKKFSSNTSQLCCGVVYCDNWINRTKLVLHQSR